MDKEYAYHDDCKIAYRVIGEGTPIVLLMGLGQPGRMWNKLADRLLKHDFQMIIPDNRGTGSSSKPFLPYHLPTMAGDVDAVLRYAEVESAMVCGVSFGGMLAQHFALDYPERVDGLLLAATTCGAPVGIFPSPRAIWLLLKVAFGSTVVTIEEVHQLLAHPDSRELLRDLMTNWEEDVDKLPTPPQGFIGQLLAAAFHNVGDRLHEIDIPTRIVCGDTDYLIPPKNSDLLAKLIRNSVRSVVERAGHIVIHEHPEALVENILELRKQVYRDATAPYSPAARYEKPLVASHSIKTDSLSVDEPAMDIPPPGEVSDTTADVADA